MVDNEWMYSGHIGPNRTTEEWAAKTDVFLKEIHRGPKRAPPHCPCVRCENRHRLQKSKMTKHLCKYGYMKKFIMPVNFAEEGHAREEVMRQRVDDHEDDGLRNLVDDMRAAEMP